VGFARARPRRATGVAHGLRLGSVVGKRMSVSPLERDDPHVATTFLFADIAGFTALTEAHGDEEAANLVADFANRIRAELPPRGAAHVKTIGDALMLRIDDPGEAIRVALRIGQVMRDHGAPAVRVGLHHGPAVERDGDYFGATVNLAARVSAEAVGGEVLVTGATAALAPDLDGVIYEPRGRRELRNVSEPVELFAAIPLGEAGETDLAADPVCRMTVDPQRAVGRIVFDDEVFFLCSLECTAAFARRPERFARKR
jgi:adenylate cyclase